MQVKRDITRPRRDDRSRPNTIILIFHREGIFKLATEHDKLLYIYIPADGRSPDTIIVSGKAPIKK